MEFVMSYAWAIMITLVVIGGLAYLGVNPSKILPSSCIIEPGIACIETKVNHDSVTLILRNGRGEDINVSSIKVARCSGEDTGILRDGKTWQFVVTGCNNPPNTRFSGDINITYTGEKSLSHYKQGRILDEVEQGCTGSCACNNTDVSCGLYPACNSCNVLDSYSANFCNGSDVYRNFNDYSCASQQCNPAIILQLVQSCNGTCVNGACACSGSDTNCGTYPSCNNCNSLDSYSANYCTGNDVYKNFSDYSCANQNCNPAITPQLVQSCVGNNGICQSSACACSNTVSSCGTYPSCTTCGANQICQNSQCITQTCTDGTIINQCSSTKPLYCNSGLSLVNSCSTCGCPAGKVCQGDESCVNAVSSLSASHTITSIQDLGGGWKRYNYDITLTESAGVNVNIQSTYSLCSSLYGCVSGTSTFGLITGGTSATRSGSFDTTLGDTVTSTYSWNDVNSNSGTVSRAMSAP